MKNKLCNQCKERKIMSKGLCNRCYNRKMMKKLRQENPTYKIKAKEYQQTHRELYAKSKKKHYYKNREKILLKFKKYLKKYNKKFPERNTARTLAAYYKLRGDECELCKSKKNLHFHHLDYKRNIGVTLCCLCHMKLHAGIIQL